MDFFDNLGQSRSYEEVLLKNAQVSLRRFEHVVCLSQNVSTKDPAQEKHKL